MPDTDPLTAELDAIGERHEHMRSRYGYVAGLLALAGAKDDLPRLLKVAEAVLALHQPAPFSVLGALCEEHEVFRHFSITAVEAERARACPECSAVVCVSCTCGQADRERCPTLLAIAGELLGKEDDRD
jgi:hypothetical protein